MKKILSIIFPAAVFALCAYLVWGKTHNPTYSDFGREIYIPWRISQGALLYRDLVNFYGLITYQFNGALFSVFGTSINVVFSAAFICTIIATVTLYKIAGYILPDSVKTAYIYFLILIFIFGFNSYVIPYSYSLLYGTTLFYLTLLFCLRYVRFKKFADIFPACIFFGLAICNKYEFLPFILILGWLIIRFKRLSIRQTILCISGVVFPAVLSLGILFYLGISGNDLFNSLNLISRLVNSPTLKTFYLYSSSVIPHIKYIKYYFRNLVFLSSLIIGLFALYFISTKYFIEDRAIAIRKVFIIALGGLLLSIVGFISVFAYINYLFCWLPVSVAVLLTYRIVVQRKKWEPAYLLIALASVIMSLKGLFIINLVPYGVFLLPLSLMVIIRMGIDYLLSVPGIIKNTDKYINFILYTTASVLFVFCIFLFSIEKFAILKTGRDQIPVSDQTFTVISETLDYLTRYTKANDKVLVLPEGQIINYLSNRKSDDFLSGMFMPPLVEAYGENNLIDRMKNAHISIIIIMNKTVNEYFAFPGRNQYFGSAYGISILNYIKSNYVLQKTIGDNNFITIYGPTNIPAAD